jgi:hypothetical protein
MYKSLCVAVLLLATLSFTSGSKPADASAALRPSPVIVARMRFKGVTTSLPTTTIFTPEQDGLYRLSAYDVETSPASDGSLWTFFFNWTDDAGAESGNSFALPANGTPPQAYGGTASGIPGSVMVFQAKAGTPVTFFTLLSGGSDGGTYNLYLEVERLP